MDEVKTKKIMAISRIIAVVCAVLELILLGILFNSMDSSVSWSPWVYTALKPVAMILWAGVLVPPLFALALKSKLRDKKLCDLEAEVERLKRKS